MASPLDATTKAEDWARRGSAAVDAHDLQTAKKCFKRAAQVDSYNAERRFHLAIILEALHEFPAAAEELIEALRLDPHSSQATRRLTSLLASRNLPAHTRLNSVGLKAILQHEATSEKLADAIFRHVAQSDPLRAALQSGATKGWELAARDLCLKRTAPLLKDEVFRELLRSGVMSSPELERLLIALRRILVLELPSERLEDHDLVQFAVTLMQQCWLNEYVWKASEEEIRAIAAKRLVIADLLNGSVEQGFILLLVSLYVPTLQTLGPGANQQMVGNIRPNALRDAVAAHVRELVDEQGRRIPRVGDLADPTSRKVAVQYEGAPYPRWRRLSITPRQEQFRRRIAQYFEPDRLAFLDRPFEALVAGCGTGMDAIQLALGYGPNAQVLAIDLSASSLAYAARMADRFGAGNLTFMQADILEIGEQPAFASRFRMIECGGVLHHMAAPLQGWSSLIKCLASGGVMRVGLYSATARSKLMALRSDPAYPGADCDDKKLRAFRQLLMDRPQDQVGGELKLGLDFYTTSSFRDLALHISERCHSIPEIANFLRASGLRFRGFHPASFFDRLHQQYPDERWPGSLERWTELERALPSLFAAMYVIWCEKA